MEPVLGLASTAVRELTAGGSGNPYESYKPPEDPCALTPFGCLTNFWCDPQFGLADAKYDYCYVKAAYGELAIVETSRLPWLYSHGSDAEHQGALAMQWMAFALCIICLVFYAYHSWKATTGWEEVYVCVVELVKVLLEIYKEFESPASIYLPTANAALWLRYGEWLLTCPVILIHLSNITGLKDDYNKRTMQLLVSDIGCVVWGITAAFSVGWLKWVFFVLGLLYGSNTYFHAAKVYIESYHTVPKGHCRLIVRLMAYCFYVAWTMYPILFILGPEGLGHMSAYMSTALHGVADMLSKQIWGLLGHHLRVKIFEHILIHGDIRKTTTMQVGGQMVQVEEMVDEEDEDTI
nr:CnChR2 [synthetic construct]